MVIRHYNEGMALRLGRNFRDAQAKFEAALALDERLAEAHNNLACVLRMQGRHNFAASLTRYDRAIALKPRLAQACVYCGVRFALQGQTARARQDLALLRDLDAKRAADLERAIDGVGGPADPGGIAPQYERAGWLPARQPAVALRPRSGTETGHSCDFKTAST